MRTCTPDVVNSIWGMANKIHFRSNSPNVQGGPKEERKKRTRLHRAAIFEII
jgi:hypothetical protein